MPKDADYTATGGVKYLFYFIVRSTMATWRVRPQKILHSDRRIDKLQLRFLSIVYPIVNSVLAIMSLYIQITRARGSKRRFYTCYKVTKVDLPGEYVCRVIYRYLNQGIHLAFLRLFLFFVPLFCSL